MIVIMRRIFILVLSLLSFQFVNSLPLGINLPVIWQGSTHWPFIDIFKHANAFYPQSSWNGINWGYAPASSLQLGADGYPNFLQVFSFHFNL